MPVPPVHAGYFVSSFTKLPVILALTFALQLPKLSRSGFAVFLLWQAMQPASGPNTFDVALVASNPKSPPPSGKRGVSFTETRSIGTSVGPVRSTYCGSTSTRSCSATPQLEIYAMRRP